MDLLLLETQKGINSILKKNIDEDGDLGPQSIGAKAELAAWVRERFTKLGYTWNPINNLIGVRMDDTYTNHFSDFCIITIGYSDCVIVPMSTKPGIGKVLNPPTVAGVKGVAVMKEGQYLDLYELNSAWWSGMPFLLQVGAVECYRDSNLDLQITRTSTVMSDKDLGYRFKLNFHSFKNTTIKWSWNLDVLSYLKPDKTYSNLTEGCQVTKVSHLELILPYLNNLSKYERIPYTLLLL